MAMIIISRRMKKMSSSSSSRRRFHVTIRSLLLLSLLCCLCFQQASAHGGIDDGDDDEDSPSPVAHDHATNTKGLVAVKVWCLVILLVSTFVAGVSPYFLRWNEAFLVLGTQFAAGVFLGTSLMHFLADSTETFRALAPSKHYPFSFMLTCVGFLLTMLADCAILAVAKRSRDQVRANNNDNDEEEEQAQDQGRGRHPYPSKDEDDDHHHPLSVVTRTSSFEDAVLLVLALCFHSVFEGIAIGVSPTKSDAWRNLWTIGLHKVFAAVAMGIALLRFLPKRPLLASVAYSLAFAVSSPVGVGIGIGVIDAAPQARAWVYAVSMGLATGIFVYVAVNHLMAKGYRPHRPCRADRPFFKFLAVLLGVAVMAVAMIWD